MTTWITNGTLVTQDPRRRVLKAHVKVEAGKIAEIRRSLPSRLGGAKVINANGLHIFPGFVQAHVHLCQTLFRNQADDLELLDWLSKRIWKMEAAHTEFTLKTSALLGIHELLTSGTTCILDMGTVRHTDAIFEAVKQSGIRASVGKCLMDHPKTTPPGLREPTKVALDEAQALFKKWNGREGDRIRASFAPRFVVSCTEELMRAVGQLSEKHDALIHTHASENLKEIQLVKKLVACENVEYLHQLALTSPRLVLAHCIWLKPHEKQILARTGTHVVHCPSSNLKLASGLAHVPEMRARGINVALGADGAPCNNNLNMFQEMRLAALIHKPGQGPRSLRAQEALDMATLAGAHALGWSKTIGSIVPGKAADLIAVDLRGLHNTLPENQEAHLESIASALVYSSGPSDVRWTMVQGRVVARNGRVRTIPREKLLENVRSAQRIIQRALPKTK